MNGFYYDFDVEKPFTDDDKARRLRNEMKKIIKEDIEIDRFYSTKKRSSRFNARISHINKS